MSAAASAIRAIVCVALLAALAACGGGSRGGRSGGYTGPGPAGDPWGPYIQEASARFNVPETWVREVMRQESGGHQYLGGQPTTSSAGATGLMQVMPATYAGLAARYGLGSDPYDPHDNIMAGTAYIREMYDRYGASNFLAAYNAGPRRVDQYLAGTSALPAETVNYVAAIGPRLGGAGPRTAYAQTSPQASSPAIVMARMEPVVSPGDPGYADASPPQVLARMEPIASAGDPGIPPVEAARMEPLASPGDPGIPPIVAAMARAPLGAPLPAVLARLHAAEQHAAEQQGAEQPSRSPPPGFLTVPASYQARPAVAERPAIGGGYGVQVGAFASAAEARTAADAARGLSGTLGAQSMVASVPRPDGRALFRARLTGLSADQAAAACRHIQASGKPCFVVPPDGTS